MKCVFDKPFNAAIDAIDSKLEKFDPIWQSEHGVGGLRSRYYDKTGIAKYREWRGCRDTMLDYVTWLKNLGMMGLMVAKDPVHMMKAFWEYRWMGSFLGSFAFVDRLFEGFRGRELEVASLHSNTIVRTLCGLIGTIVGNDRRLGGGPLTDQLVGLDETIPTLFFAGFPTLYPEPMQTLPEFVICDVDQHIEPYYIDVAESYGLPADVCSRCSAETGVSIDDAFPILASWSSPPTSPATPASPPPCSSAAASTPWAWTTIHSPLPCSTTRRKATPTPLRSCATASPR